MNFLQSEYTGLVVKGRFDRETASLFKCLEKHTTSFKGESLDNLKTAAEIAAVRGRTIRKDNFRSRPWNRGRGRGNSMGIPRGRPDTGANFIPADRDELKFKSMCYDEWESIEASPTVIGWIKNGVELPFQNKPLPFEYRNRHFNKKEQSFLQSEVAGLLEIGVIERDNNACHISPINCVPKRNNKFRLVADLRYINSHINSKNFKYDNILSITENIKPDDRLVTVDIKDGFYHIPVSKQSQEYLAFAFEGQNINGVGYLSDVVLVLISFVKR